MVLCFVVVVFAFPYGSWKACSGRKIAYGILEVWDPSKTLTNRHGHNI